MTKTVTKEYALLISPSRIYETPHNLDVLEIDRSGKHLRYDIFEFNDFTCKSYLKRGRAENVKASLALLTTEELQYAIDFNLQQFHKQRSGLNAAFYSKRFAQRHHIECLSQLAANMGDLKIYHRTEIEPGRFVIKQCMLNANQPKLSFKVVKTSADCFKVEPLVEIGNTLLPLYTFRRFEYLLELENEYYILANRDQLTLQSIQQKQGDSGLPISSFIDEIVKSLEENYPVDRGGLLSVNEVKAEPVHCLYFSEISEKFLMLTPRWRYDGFEAEGEFDERFEVNVKGEIFAVYRHQDAEKAFVEKLRALHPNFKKQLNGYFYLSFEDAKKRNWFLKLYRRLLEDNVELIGLDMLRHFRYNPHPPQSSIQLVKTIDHLISFRFTIAFGELKVNIRDVQRVLQQGQHVIMLPDDSIGALDEAWCSKYETLLKHGKAEGEILSVPKWLLIADRTEEERSIFKPVISQEWRKKWQQWQEADETVFTIPSNVNAALRPYQQKGFEWMMLLSEIGAGACLADDMGLGKTLQSICFLAAQQEKFPDRKHIIVCPLSLIQNWKQELEKFTPHLSAFVYYDNQRNVEAFLESGAEVLITGYHGLRADEDKLSAIRWQTAIIDESHNIKNYAAKITRSVLMLRSENRIILSGTPILNNTSDLYSQFDFILPDLLGSREFFTKEYAQPIDRNNDPAKTKELQQIVNPFVLRRTKQQVATDLPDKIESVLWCSMEAAQRSVYEKIKQQVRASVFLNIQEQGLTKSKLNVLQAIMRLRQICCSPALIENDDIDTTDSIKIEILTDEIRTKLRGKKVLVFSQFKKMLRLLESSLAAIDVKSRVFDGETSMDERNEIVNVFQDKLSDTNVLLLSLKAGNAGLNLTAAEYVFLIDPWWNKAIEQQAIDRTHRIGQTKNVFAYKLICKDTIEEKIMQIQNRKSALSEDLIAAEEGFVKNLSMDDLNFLFE